MKRRPRAALPPPGLRPRLTSDQVASIRLIHEGNVAAIAAGGASQQVLYDHAHSVLVWLTLARDYHERYGTLGEALRVMQAAQAACTDLVERWRRTGRVVFTGPEFVLARDVAPVMDAIAELVDAHDADAAGRAAIRALRDLAPVVEVAAA